LNALRRYVREKSHLKERVKVEPYGGKLFGIYENYFRMTPETVF
jgi:hypothetical protein